MNNLAVLALTAGASIAIQATMNARLGVLLKSSMMATSIAFLFGCILTIFIMILWSKPTLQLAEIKSVPLYLWFSGGALSAFGVGMFYYLIPKMGMGSMMSYALAGQILVAIIASHFGWFELPVKPITFIKVIGAILLVISVFLINWESGYGHR